MRRSGSIPPISWSVSRATAAANSSTMGAEPAGTAIDGARLAGDRVVLVPPLDTNQPHRTASERAREQLGEDLDRVAAVFVNGESRMAAFEAGDIDLQLGPALRAGARRQVEDQIGRATAGTAYEQRPVFLGIQVEHASGP